MIKSVEWLAGEIAEVLNSERWSDRSDGMSFDDHAHQRHRFCAWCAVCSGDVDAIARVAAAAAFRALVEVA